MIESERNITRNAMLCDGTPRRENGYRPHVTTVGPDVRRFGLQRRVWIGPLFETKDEAMLWVPSCEAILRAGAAS